MRRTCLALAILLFPALALAAGPQRKPRSASKRSSAQASGPRRPDLFGGYSYTRAGEARLHGWELSGSLPFRRSLRLVADLSGHYGSFAGADLGQTSFFAGARRPLRGGRLRPFVQVLLGGARSTTRVDVAGGSFSDSDTAWGGALGGGADYPFSRRWAARGQLDVLLLRSQGAWDSNPRLSIGAVYRFGQ